MKKVVGKKETKPGLAQELRNLGALIENNNHKIGVVAEQYIGINKKLDSHAEMVGRLAEDVSIIKTNV